MERSNLGSHELLTFDSLPSTSTYLRENSLPIGTVVRAHSQSTGRGRRGNSFHSAEGGLYFSISLPRKMADEDMWAVTFMAAVAVCDAIESYGGCPKIKWVNDIFIGDKKVCGILSEVREDCLILGIGVNVKNTLSAEIRDIATTLEDEGISADADTLLSDILKGLDESFAHYDIHGTVEKYRGRCMLTGRNITYSENGEKKYALAVGIADNGNLICEKDGVTFTLHSGEVFEVRSNK